MLSHSHEANGTVHRKCQGRLGEMMQPVRHRAFQEPNQILPAANDSTSELPMDPGLGLKKTSFSLIIYLLSAKGLQEQ